MTKYENYFLNKSISYEGKTVAITGATGSLGFYIAYFVLLKGAKIILVGRNYTKLEETKNKLLEKFENSDIRCLICDASKIEDSIQLAKDLENAQIDYLFNNAGCYHLPVKMVGKYDITYITNFVSPIYLTQYLCKKLPNLIVIQTASLSYRFTKLNLNDIQFIKKDDKTKRYGSSKRLLILSSFKLQKELNNKIYLTHAGVSTTSLFSSSKGGFNKVFNKIIVPIMKVIFMKPEKAALSIVLAPSTEYKKETLIGPKGIFQVWGYPKEHKLEFGSFKKFEQNGIETIMKDTLDF
jgi:short-subunit dehydrogenase